jgi:hypothetical protein
MSCAATGCEEIRVTRKTNSGVDNKESIGKSRRNELDLSSYAPTDFEFAEFFGGAEYFWRSPFSLIRLFEEEDK